MNTDKNVRKQKTAETAAGTAEDTGKAAPAARTVRLKTLATCKPSEFLKQTYRIKRAAEKWLTDTDILNIRKNVPKMPTLGEDATDEERKRAEEAFQKELVKARNENLSRMFEAIAEKHPEETLELLALCCFVEPANVDDYEVGDYLSALAEMLGHRATLNFFVSSMRLAQIVMPLLQPA